MFYSSLVISWCSLLLEFLENTWNFWKTPGIPGKHQEFLENTWNSWKTHEVWSFLSGPRKLLEKNIFALLPENSWNFVIIDQWAPCIILGHNRTFADLTGVRLAYWSSVTPPTSTTRDWFSGFACGLRFVDLNLTPMVFLQVLWFSSSANSTFKPRSVMSRD